MTDECDLTGRVVTEGVAVISDGAIRPRSIQTHQLSMHFFLVLRLVQEVVNDIGDGHITFFRAALSGNTGHSGQSLQIIGFGAGEILHHHRFDCCRKYIPNLCLSRALYTGSCECLWWESYQRFGTMGVFLAKVLPTGCEMFVHRR